jgi:Spy/CpxP family protein refolding chaperone
MKKLCRLAVVFGLAVLIASPALAQSKHSGRSHGQRPQGFYGASLFLLSQESVQKDLKLSDAQVTKIKDLQNKQHEAFKGFKDLSGQEKWTKMQAQAKANRKAIKEILTPEQKKRSKQISLQLAGARALRYKPVAEALKITTEQKDKIKAIWGEAFKEMGKLRGSKSQDAHKKLAEIGKSTNEKVMNVLTSEQKAKYKEMTGEPFKGKIRPPVFGGVRAAGAKRPR